MANTDLGTIANTDLGKPFLEDAIESVRFFDGRLLMARDLTREQEAQRRRLLRLGAAAGSGIVEGLMPELPEDKPGGTAIRISAGLGVNARGAVLRLRKSLDVALPATPAAAAVAVAGSDGFAPCASASAAPAAPAWPRPDGVDLLVLRPVRVTSGVAPALGVPQGSEACLQDKHVDGVEVALVPLPLGAEILFEGKRGGEDDAAAAGRAARERNRVAAACFGLDLQDTSALDSPLDRRWGALDLAQPPALLSSELPLAILRWRAGKVEWLDAWAIRRPLHRRAASVPLERVVDERRSAESVAFAMQFREHVATLRGSASSASGESLRGAFDWLPPAGILPAGLWKAFLGDHAPPAAVAIDAGLARGRFSAALQLDPIRLSQLPRVAIDVWQPRRGTEVPPDWVVFTRSTRGRIEIAVRPVGETSIPPPALASPSALSISATEEANGDEWRALPADGSLVSSPPKDKTVPALVRSTPSLPAGRYSVRAAGSAIKSTVAADVDVVAGEVATIDLAVDPQLRSKAEIEVVIDRAPAPTTIAPARQPKSYPKANTKGRRESSSPSERGLAVDPRKDPNGFYYRQESRGAERPSAAVDLHATPDVALRRPDGSAVPLARPSLAQLRWIADDLDAGTYVASAALAGFVTAISTQAVAPPADARFQLTLSRAPLEEPPRCIDVPREKLPVALARYPEVCICIHPALVRDPPDAAKFAEVDGVPATVLDWLARWRDWFRENVVDFTSRASPTVLVSKDRRSGTRCFALFGDRVAELTLCDESRRLRKPVLVREVTPRLDAWRVELLDYYEVDLLDDFLGIDPETIERILKPGPGELDPMLDSLRKLRDKVKEEFREVDGMDDKLREVLRDESIGDLVTLANVEASELAKRTGDLWQATVAVNSAREFVGESAWSLGKLGLSSDDRAAVEREGITTLGGFVRATNGGASELGSKLPSVADAADSAKSALVTTARSTALTTLAERSSAALVDDDLDRLGGIDVGERETLRSNGVFGIGQLRSMSAEEVAAATGFTKERATNIVESAKSATADTASSLAVNAAFVFAGAPNAGTEIVAGLVSTGGSSVRDKLVTALGGAAAAGGAAMRDANAIASGLEAGVAKGRVTR